ncbi:MAG: hypothetical protein ACJ77N_09550 [Chloroflexota bacterium]
MTELMATLGAVHAILTVAFVGLVLALLVLAAAAALRAGVTRTIIDRLVLVAVPLALLNAVAGLVLLVLGAAPSDWLHAVYAVVVVLALPVSRALAARRTRGTGLPSPDRLGRWLLIGSLVTLGALLRLAMTG